MTEKRFTYEYDEYNGNLFDNEFGTFYHIEDSEENIELLCQRLNAQHEKIEQLRNVNAQLVELLSGIGLKTDTALKLLYGK